MKITISLKHVLLDPKSDILVEMPSLWLKISIFSLKFQFLGKCHRLGSKFQFLRNIRFKISNLFEMSAQNSSSFTKFPLFHSKFHVRPKFSDFRLKTPFSGKKIRVFGSKFKPFRRKMQFLGKNRKFRLKILFRATISKFRLKIPFSVQNSVFSLKNSNFLPKIRLLTLIWTIFTEKFQFSVTFPNFRPRNEIVVKGGLATNS